MVTIFDLVIIFDSHLDLGLADIDTKNAPKPPAVVKF
jgi:hypothetical protein